MRNAKPTGENARATKAMTTLSPTASGRGASELVIDLENVAKTYSGRFGRKKIQALRGIEMRVHRGEIFGLLGPNGAGKSTLVKILMTIIRSTTCRGVMLGRPVGDTGVLARVGYLPEHHRFPEYLTGAQVLDHFAAMCMVPRAARRKRAGELLELVGMSAWADKRVKSYSKGMRQRLGIANALTNSPELVLLDEPTDGVDPVGRKDIREILVRLREQGTTVFLNSHLLSELEMVCDRVAILVQGVVSAQGTMAELTRDNRRYEIEVIGTNGPSGGDAKFLPEALREVALLPDPGAVADSAPAVLSAISPAVPAGSRGDLSGRLRAGDIPIEIDNNSISVGTDDPEVIQPLLDVLRRKGVTIRAVRPVRASLEDLFMIAVTDPATGKARAPGAAASTAGKGGRA